MRSHENNKKEEKEEEEETEDLGFIDPMGIADRMAKKHIAMEDAVINVDELKKLNARLNVHKHVRNFLIILVKIAQKHAKENPKSELAGLGMMLVPISKHIIEAIVKEIKSDPEDLCKLIEFFYEKLEAEGFFIDDEQPNDETTKEG